MSEIKAFPFPVLSPDSADYNDGVGYSARISKMGDAPVVQVHHHLVGDSLVANLLREKAAVFACIVSVPSTMYRCIAVANGHEPECSQNIDYSESGHGDDTDIVESPMFRPVVLATSSISKSAKQSAGLGALWSGSAIVIPDGAIIAFDNWRRLKGSGSGLLIVEKDDDLANGQMRVSPDAGGGFRFHVKVGGNLYDQLRFPPSGYEKHRTSVLTHALSTAFQILKSDFATEWKEHVNLRIVAETLKRENIPHWGDDDFLPEEAATILYPHLFNEATEENDGGN